MPKLYRVIMHPGANRDVLEVADYIRDIEDDPVNAQRFIDLVQAQGR